MLKMKKKKKNCSSYYSNAHLRLVHIIVFKEPEVGGHEAQLLLSAVKARED